MVTLTFVRHGQTFANADPSGPTELTPTGILQARALAARLAKVSWDGLYSSALSRALATARHIHEDQQHLEFRTSSLWNEIHSSIVGRPWSETETAADVPGDLARMDECWEALHHLQGRIIVVCHANVIRYLVGRCLYIAEPHRGALGVDNCSISILTNESGRWKLKLLNDISHLSRALLESSSRRDICF